jgi:hypothetical protein
MISHKHSTLVRFFDGSTKQLNVDRIANYQSTVIHQFVVGDVKILADELQPRLKTEQGVATMDNVSRDGNLRASVSASNTATTSARPVET